MLIAKFIDSIQKFIKIDELCAYVIRVARAYIIIYNRSKFSAAK